MTLLMKKISIIFLILLSSSSLSETYVCSQELSRHGSPGEIETVTYERIGTSFLANSSYFYEIFFESKSNLILSVLFESTPVVGIVFIDKDTKEWGLTLVSMEELSKHPPYPNTYGKCTLVK